MSTIKQLAIKAAPVAAARQERMTQNLNTEMTDDGFMSPDLAMRARMNDFGIGFDDGDLMDGF